MGSEHLECMTVVEHSARKNKKDEENTTET